MTVQSNGSVFLALGIDLREFLSAGIDLRDLLSVSIDLCVDAPWQLSCVLGWRTAKVRRMKGREA